MEFIDKAILIGTGLEKKIKELLVELEEKGKAEGAEEGQPAKERIENRVVEDGIKAVKELLCVLREGKDRIESEVVEGAESLTGKLNLATASDLEEVKEMARAAREKTDKLEKRVKKLEGK